MTVNPKGGRPRNAVLALDAFCEVFEQLPRIRRLSLDFVPPPDASWRDIETSLARIGFRDIITDRDVKTIAQRAGTHEDMALGSRLADRLTVLVDRFAALVAQDRESGWLSKASFAETQILRLPDGQTILAAPIDARTAPAWAVELRDALPAASLVQSSRGGEKPINLGPADLVAVKIARLKEGRS